jgi:hypothetical protein
MKSYPLLPVYFYFYSIVLLSTMSAAPLRIEVVSSPASTSVEKSFTLDCVISNGSTKTVIIPKLKPPFSQIYVTSQGGELVPSTPQVLVEFVPLNSPDIVILGPRSEQRFKLGVKCSSLSRRMQKNFAGERGIAILSDGTTNFLIATDCYIALRFYAPEGCYSSNLRRRLTGVFWEGDILSKRRKLSISK